MNDDALAEVLYKVWAGTPKYERLPEQTREIYQALAKAARAHIAAEGGVDKAIAVLRAAQRGRWGGKYLRARIDEALEHLGAGDEA